MLHTLLVEHRIAGRGVLLDFRSYSYKKGIEYDPFETYSISYEVLQVCGKEEGIDIHPPAQGGDVKPGDMLFVRSGWVEQYWAKTLEERAKLQLGEEHRSCGVAQEEKMIDWLHDCYFATVAGDALAFEALPPQQSDYVQKLRKI